MYISRGNNIFVQAGIRPAREQPITDAPVPDSIEGRKMFKNADRSYAASQFRALRNINKQKRVFLSEARA
jgi:hypothetical protein